MVAQGMKKFLFVVAASVALTACAPPQYSADDLSARHAKEVRGVITRQSRGSFVMRDDSGEEKLYRTGQLTQYMPEDYRSLEGDTVRVAFEESWAESGKIKRAVLQLQAISIPDKNKPLSEPIKGEIVAIGRGSSQHAVSLVFKIDGKEEGFPVYISTEVGSSIKGYDINMGWSGLVGKEAVITTRRLPILRGNGYLYEAVKIALK